MTIAPAPYLPPPPTCPRRLRAAACPRHPVDGQSNAIADVHMQVYYEIHQSNIEAARREKRFKNWPRQWKINLIEQLNSEWHALYEDICR